MNWISCYVLRIYYMKINYMFNGQFKSILNKITVKKKSKLKPSRHSTKALPTYRFIYDNCSCFATIFIRLHSE